MITTSRSAIAAWSICEQLWMLEHRLGLEPVVPRLDATTSRCAHHGLARMLKGTDPREAARLAVQRFQGLASMAGRFRLSSSVLPVTRELLEEQGALIEAQVRGWALFRLEWLTGSYQVESVERPQVARLADDVSLRIVPDAVLTRPTSQAVTILDFKSVDRVGGRWADQWRTDPQPMAYSVGIAPALWELPDRVEGFRVEMLPRGERRDGHQVSPLVYGFAATAYPPHPAPLTRPEKFGKAVRFLVARDLKAADPVGTWLTTHAQTFRHLWGGVTVPPPHPAEAERWVKEVVTTERRLAQSEPGDIRRQGMSGGRCSSKMGRCPFYDVCWTPGIADDPVGSGLYKPRPPRWEEEGEDDE